MTKQQISNVLREKLNLLQKHVSLRDNFYFSQWANLTRRRLFGSHIKQYARVHSRRGDKQSHADLNNQQDSDEAVLTIGFDAIHEHLEKRNQERDAARQTTPTDPSKSTSHDASQKIKLLGRFIHNSVKSARGIASWSKSAAEDSEAVDILATDPGGDKVIKLISQQTIRPF
eukprot:UN00787